MLIKLENKFDADSKLREMYCDILAEYEELGHMSRLPLFDINGHKNRFYISHHGVWKEKSTTNKKRTVFNASVKIKSGDSTNSLLLPGPN